MKQNNTEFSATQARREKVQREGFCIFPAAFTTEEIAQLQRTCDALLAAQDPATRARTRAQGSMLGTNSDAAFADLIAHSAILRALAQLGFEQPTFSDGYIISKPGHSPRLFWHYDWFAWEDDSAYEMAAPQLFAMIYLSDTRRENGCLRAIPGSHLQHNALHDLLDAPHSQALSEARDLNLPEFSDREDECDIAVRAGDLIIGDARLLHAAHANTTDERRTLITLWYQPDFSALPPAIQAQMAAKTQPIPDSWPATAREKLQPLLATTRFEGDAQPCARSLYRRASK